jgi:hypothetical protein
MIDFFVPALVRRLVIYPTPINARWGPDRLRTACERDLGLKLDRTTAVIFHNRRQDTLVLYAVDGTGDRCITKKLDRGAFLLPLCPEGQPYVVLEASNVSSLFRS